MYQWVQDWYGAYPAGAMTDPTGPASGPTRVARGGAYDVVLGTCRSAYRGGSVDSYRDKAYGFRLAKSQ